MIVVSFGCAILFGLGAVNAIGDPNLGDVRPHRHWIQNSSGELVQVGPRVCDDPSLQAAFNQFHNNLHISAGHGPAAPGLHNGMGGEIVATPC